MLLGDNVGVSQQSGIEGKEEQQIQQFCSADTTSGDYALPPSIMYSAIERGAHRRKTNVFDTLKCFSDSGAFAFLIAVSIEKFYDFFNVESNTTSFNKISVLALTPPTLNSRYCESSVALII